MGINLKGSIDIPIRVNALLVNLVGGELKLEFQPDAPGYTPTVWTINKATDEALWLKYADGRRSFDIDGLLEAAQAEGVIQRAATQMWGLALE